MDFQHIMRFLVPVMLLVLGLMTKFSNNDGWSSYKKYWIYFVVIGATSLIYAIYKYPF